MVNFFEHKELKKDKEQRLVILINDDEFDEHYMIFIVYKKSKLNKISKVNFQVVDKSYSSLLYSLKFKKYEKYQIMFDDELKKLINDSISWLKSKKIKEGNFLEKIIKKYKVI